ncbi:MAG: nitroreductase family protein [Candidatus Hodarchaeales archaeon]
MDVLNCIMNSNRIFKYGDPESMTTDEIKLLMSAGQLSPYIGNEQGIHFIVVTDREIINKISEFSEDQVSKASILVAGLADIQVPGSIVNSVVANHQICLVAISMQKAARLIASFDDNDLRDQLDIPENYKITSLLAIGSKSAEKPSRLKTEKLERLVSVDKFGTNLV